MPLFYNIVTFSILKLFSYLILYIYIYKQNKGSRKGSKSIRNEIDTQLIHVYTYKVLVPRDMLNRHTEELRVTQRTTIKDKYTRFWSPRTEKYSFHADGGGISEQEYQLP